MGKAEWCCTLFDWIMLCLLQYFLNLNFVLSLDVKSDWRELNLRNLLVVESVLKALRGLILYVPRL